MEMPPVFQKPILKRESQVTSMPNLISNLFGGSFFFFFLQEMLINTASDLPTQFIISKQIRKTIF